MKYIYYILAAVLVSALALALMEFGGEKKQARKNPAIVINDRVITVDELAAMKQAHDETRPDFISNIITKELMIQEAKRSGIDREEQFRQSIQNFYEQSLVKTLMDRKLASLKITVSDEDVDRYMSLLDKKVELTVSRAATEEAKKEGRATDERMIIAFADLSGRMKAVVLSLGKGGSSTPFFTGSDYAAVTLRDIQSGGVRPKGLGRDAVRAIITEDRREQAITDWLDGMRKRSKIEIKQDAVTGG
jgi:hypothetical protein